MLRYLKLLLAALCAIAGPFAGAGELPVSLIHVPESTATLFVAETSSARFHRFDRLERELKHSGSYYMSIGQRGPGKQRSGDRRTPIGIYFVTEQLDTSRLHEKYGVTAFPLDYPNAWDLMALRDGDGIWVHGVDPKGGRRPELDTDGCIALPNEDLLALEPLFVDNVTPVLVTETVEWTDSASSIELQRELEAAISRWLAARVDGEFYRYASSYHPGFSRWEMTREEWIGVVMDNNSWRLAAGTIDDVLLLGYPSEEGLYFSRFRLTFDAPGGRIARMTRLYWRRDDTGVLRIVAEDVG